MIKTEYLYLKSKNYNVYVQDNKKSTTLFMPRIDSACHTVEHELLMYVALAFMAKQYQKDNKEIIIERNGATISQYVVSQLIPNVEIHDTGKHCSNLYNDVERLRCLFVNLDLIHEAWDIVVDCGSLEYDNISDILVNFIPMYDNSIIMMGDYCNSGIQSYLSAMSFLFDFNRDIDIDKLAHNLAKCSRVMKSGLFLEGYDRIKNVIEKANELIIKNKTDKEEPVLLKRPNGRFIDRLVFKALNSGDELDYRYVDNNQRNFIKAYFTGNEYNVYRRGRSHVLEINDTLFYFIKDIYMLGPELASIKLLNLFDRHDINVKHIYKGYYNIDINDIFARKLIMEEN